MSIRVYTESTCTRCGEKKIKEGAHTAFPPVGWAALQATIRLEGAGWSNKERVADAVLCPKCVQAHNEFMQAGSDDSPAT